MTDRTPGPGLARLIRLARQTSGSTLLYPVSSLARKLCLAQIGGQAVDYPYEGLTIRFRPNGNTAEKRALLNPARFDPQERGFIEAHLPQGGCFLDIGANVGLYAFLASRVAGPEGQVIAFEPNPPVLERLRTNIALNERLSDRIAAVRAVGKAVSDASGTVRFAAPDRNLGEGHILEDDETSTGSIEVETTTLLAFLDEAGIGRVDMMKVDIEGHELAALSPFFGTAPEALLPRHVIIERGTPEHWQPLEALLIGAGYRTLLSTRMNEVLGL